jgi:N-acetylneuraminic acid mutarotase
VLVAGGYDAGFPPNFADAEIYNPNSGTWAPTASMNDARAAHTATLLKDGRVLVTGGFGSFFDILATAEIYDPTTGAWTYTGNMTMPRVEHTATLLPDGRVLVAGGETPTGRTNTTELYDPRTGTWTLTGNMSVERAEATLTVLNGQGRDERFGQNDGEGYNEGFGRNNGEGHDKGFGYTVLVAGGSAGIGQGGTPLNSAELYNPKTGTWTLTGNMTQPRADHAAVLLKGSGKVLVIGGRADIPGPPTYLNTAELYDPSTGTWSTTGSMASPRGEMHDATLVLKDGNVLVTGGYSAFSTPQDSAELYNPKSGTWTSAGTMSVPRAGHTATMLYNGKVLVAGGTISEIPNDVATNNADLFRPK